MREEGRAPSAAGARRPGKREESLDSNPPTPYTLHPTPYLHQDVVEANRKYHDTHAEVYDETTHVRLPHYAARVRAHLDRLTPLLPAPPTACRALDAGAGTGYFTRHLLERGFTVDAVEISEEMARRLRAKCADLLGWTLVPTDIRTVLFESAESYDLIAFVSVLHHLFDYKEILTLAADRLKPGGFLYTTCDPIVGPRSASYRAIRFADRVLEAIRHRTAPLLRGHKRVPPGEHSRLAEFHAGVGLDLPGIETMLKAAGLEPLWIERNPSTHYRWLNRLQARLGNGSDLSMLWRKPIEAGGNNAQRNEVRRITRTNSETTI